MADFELSIPVIFAHECGPQKPDGSFPNGLVDDSDDPGGLTIWGLSTPFLNSIGICTRDDILAIDQQKASDIYKANFWKYDGIFSQTIATKLFDMCVNMGTGQGTKLVQEACNDLGSTLVVDGGYGANTLAAINFLQPSQLIDAIIQRQKNFYTSLANEKPSLAKFLSGWLIRANWPNT